MLDPIAELVRFEVRFAERFRGLGQAVLDAHPDEDGHASPFSDYGYKWPAYTLAHLFALEHPGNPLRNASWCADLAMELVDKSVACWHFRRDAGNPISSREVPHYIVPYVLEALGDAVSPARRARWIEHETAYAEMAIKRPEGYTASYHDSWRMTALYRLGEVLDQPGWREMGVFLFKRMLSIQTAEGFWEDGRHHGPSMRYCGLMLPSLAWMYRWTGDEDFGDAARRLGTFMATWTHPDAVTVGSFDGRNSNVLAFFPTCAGFELTPSGRAFTARAFKLWHELKMFEDLDRTAQSTRDLARVGFYAADTCRYLQQFAPNPHDAADTASKLPADADVVLENHSAEFDGLLRRDGPWCVALSSQNSEVPKISNSPYRLDRQSRIELWHANARLMLGGGHNMPGRDVPYASAVVDTGHCGASAFGRLPAKLNPRDRLSYFMPRRAISRMEGGAPVLELVFGHGTVRFRFNLSSPERAVIEAAWDLRHVERLALQLPLVVWQDSRFAVDGRSCDRTTYALHEIKESVALSGGPFGTPFRLIVPSGAPARVHFPLELEQFHMSANPDDPVKQPFDLALVSSQWTNPARQGTALFVLEI